MSTPRNSQKKTPASSAKGQKSILGFFSKKAEASPLPARPALDKSAVARIAHNHPTPVPSSDPPEIQSSPAPIVKDRNKENGLITPLTPATNGSSADQGADFDDSDDSPVRKVQLPFKAVCTQADKDQSRKKVNYIESDDDEILRPVDGNGRGQRRSLKRRKLSPESEDEFGIDDAAEAAMMAIGMSYKS